MSANVNSFSIQKIKFILLRNIVLKKNYGRQLAKIWLIGSGIIFFQRGDPVRHQICPPPPHLLNTPLFKAQNGMAREDIIKQFIADNENLFHKLEVGNMESCKQHRPDHLFTFFPNYFGKEKKGYFLYCFLMYLHSILHSRKSYILHHTCATCSE